MDNMRSLPPVNEKYERHRDNCRFCKRVDTMFGGKRCQRGKHLVREANKALNLKTNP